MAVNIGQKIQCRLYIRNPFIYLQIFYMVFKMNTWIFTQIAVSYVDFENTVPWTRKTSPILLWMPISTFYSCRKNIYNKYIRLWEAKPSSIKPHLLLKSGTKSQMLQIFVQNQWCAPKCATFLNQNIGSKIKLL